MFNELIEIDKDGNAFLQDSSIALMPKLWAVYKDKYGGSNMVRWVVSMDDYKSPFRRLPEDERSERLTMNIFGKRSMKKTSEKLVMEAREEYKLLQFDPMIDQYNAMSEQMFLMTKVFRSMVPTKDNLEDLNDMQIKMQKAAEAREKLKAMIIKDQDSDSQIQGTGSEDFSIFENEERLEA
jgi:hypothetical protein